MATTPNIQFERGLPAALDAERSILGAILLDNHHYQEASERIVAEDFALDPHRRIFMRMAELIDQSRAVDIITLREILSRHKELEAIGGVAYLASLTENLPRRLSIAEYVRIVHEKSLARETISALSDGITEAADQSGDTAEIVDGLQARLHSISERGVQGGGFQTIEQAILSRHAGIEAFLKNSVVLGSVSTGYPDFDRMTGKLKKGELVIVAGRPSMGKTAWAINVATNAAVRQGSKVAVFSLEMPKDALIWRMVSSELPHDTPIDSQRLRDNRITPHEKVVVYDTLGKLMEAGLYIEDAPPYTLAVLRAKARRLQQMQGLDLLVIDYLQLMTPPRRGENRNQEVAEMSRGLKLLAKELDLPVICLSQLSRACEARQDKTPMLSDLRDSGAIEQDADLVLFPFRPEVYNDDIALKGTAKLIIAKQREGPLGSIPMLYFHSRTRFEEHATYVSQQEDRRGILYA